MLGDGSGVVVRRRPLVWGLARFQVGCGTPCVVARGSLTGLTLQTGEVHTAKKDLEWAVEDAALGEYGMMPHKPSGIVIN